jgi:aminoglycoside phosphotransferase (APT) family kinase protein
LVGCCFSHVRRTTARLFDIDHEDLPTSQISGGGSIRWDCISEDHQIMERRSTSERETVSCRSPVRRHRDERLASAPDLGILRCEPWPVCPSVGRDAIRQTWRLSVDDTPDLGPVPTRLSIDADQACRLVEAQFPHWAHLPVTPVVEGGWDNWTFRLGADMVVRLPSASEYARAVPKEQRWLPILAASLPLPIPVPVAQGRPSADYPHPWSVYLWLDGEPATVDRISTPVRFATELAHFLSALQQVDPANGPDPGIHNWYRGGTLRTFAGDTERALRELSGLIDSDRARAIWIDALDAPWDGARRWFHGDVARGNLLLDGDGQLAAVIDFGTCGVGDPACDLAVAWTLLTDDGRQAFRDELAVDRATWRRGRGWALWKALATCSSTYEDPDDSAEFAEAEQVLDAIFGDHAAS